MANEQVGNLLLNPWNHATLSSQRFMYPVCSCSTNCLGTQYRSTFSRGLPSSSWHW